MASKTIQVLDQIRQQWENEANVQYAHNGPCAESKAAGDVSLIFLDCILDVQEKITKARIARVRVYEVTLTLEQVQVFSLHFRPEALVDDGPEGYLDGKPEAGETW